MSVLRKNQEKIITILEVLLYDPLYAWALTPKVAAKLQRQSLNSSRASIISDSSGMHFSISIHFVLLLICHNFIS